MVISPEQLNEINELLQDTAEYYCTENIMSGEKFWTVVECYAAAGRRMRTCMNEEQLLVIKVSDT